VSPQLLFALLLRFLYDDNGRSYLDCVNNVCHVGHCHPRVVRAAQRQLELLNTNTRYIYPILLKYTTQLLSTFPSKLDTVFLVCSGSEANDLALRLARTYTKQRDVICVDWAYHGHCTSLVEISPYKFKRKGGFVPPSYVHVASCPDIYKGDFTRRQNPSTSDDAGIWYANDVKRILDNMNQRGSKVAAFISESVLGCAGQIVLPANYLKHVYAYVRDAGGVCIADEVQVGFGRVGTHFWGFQTQRVVPDIVTLGKPIGNGFPMAAVVTTKMIAEAFNNGMEYFNTFGGNPVSCQVGLAVLDVIRDERLQDNALQVGSYLLQRFEELKRKHEIIGDVRGLGLFIGVELVRSRKTLEPAGEEADWIADLAKEHRVLISTDGPDHNVLKLKPPMCFSLANADQVAETLDGILSSALFSQFCSTLAANTRLKSSL